jgi:DNA-binding transcriptional LysR family regulator
MPEVAESWEIDTRHLAALCSIARTRSISRAAQELGYGQSAVSQQLASLERSIGQRLVDRGTGPKPVTLTVAGEVMLRHATVVLEQLAAARSELEQLISGETGSIRIATMQSAGARLVPAMLAAFRASWPGISVSIRIEDSNDASLDLLRSGSVDAALIEATNSRDGGGVASVELLRDRYVAVVPPSHRFADRATVSLEDFVGEDLVSGPIGDLCSTRFERELRAIGVEPRVVFRTNDNLALQRLVDAGLGSSVVPGLTVEPGLSNGAVMIPLKEDLARTILLAWSDTRTASTALTRFLETARTTITSPSAREQ